MGNAFQKWFFSFGLFLCIGFNLFATEDWSGALRAKIHGKLVKKYFQAPRVVKDPPFGWFVELDESSQGKVAELYQYLSEKEKAIFDDIHLQYVRLSANKFAILQWAHDHCDQEVTLEGELLEPDFFGQFSSFYFSPKKVVPAISKEEKNRACKELDEIVWEPSSSIWAEEELHDDSLDLPDDKPEELVAMTGKLTLRILNSNPDNGTIERGGQPLYCWMLKLEPESFKKACSTPVRASFQTPASIRASINYDSMELTGGYDDEWLCDHHNQTVTVQGYLWHAHTAHHHTPVMLDNNPWFK